jgi:hypothetical protein
VEDNKYSFEISKRNSESDLSFELKFKDLLLVTIGVSFGLKNYYSYESLLKEPIIQKMINGANGKIGLTLLQSPRGQKSLRQEFKQSVGDYRHLAFNNLENELEKMHLSPVSFFLPGEWVFWNLDLFKDINLQGIPRPGVLRENYDKVARRCGFHFNPQSNLYER